MATRFSLACHTLVSSGRRAGADQRGDPSRAFATRARRGSSWPRSTTERGGLRWPVGWAAMAGGGRSSESACRVRHFGVRVCPALDELQCGCDSRASVGGSGPEVDPVRISCARAAARIGAVMWWISGYARGAKASCSSMKRLTMPRARRPVNARVSRVSPVPGALPGEAVMFLPRSTGAAPSRPARRPRRRPARYRERCSRGHATLRWRLLRSGAGGCGEFSDQGRLGSVTPAAS